MDDTKMQTTVIVHKDRKSREIQTYVNLEGLGARTELAYFISLMAEFYGNPVSTMTRRGHLDGLLGAADQAILHMKEQTKEVAAINLGSEPPIVAGTPTPS